MCTGFRLPGISSYRSGILFDCSAVGRNKAPENRSDATINPFVPPAAGFPGESLTCTICQIKGRGAKFWQVLNQIVKHLRYVM